MENVVRTLRKLLSKLEKSNNNDKQADVLADYNIERMINEKLKQIETKFLNCGLKDYLDQEYSVVAVFEVLKEAFKIDSKYSTTWKTIENDVCSKFEKMLAQTRKLHYQDCEPSMNLLNNVVNSMPQVIQEPLRLQLEKANEDLADKEREEFIIACVEERRFDELNSKFFQLVKDKQDERVSHLMNIVRNKLIEHFRNFQSGLSKALQYDRKLDIKGILNHGEKYIGNEAWNALFLLSELVLKFGNDDDSQEQQQMRKKNKNKVTAFDNIAENALKRLTNYLQQRLNSIKQCMANNKKDDIIIKRLNCELYIVVTFKQHNEMYLIDDTTKILDERITGIMSDVYDYCVEYFTQQMEQKTKDCKEN